MLGKRGAPPQLKNSGVFSSSQTPEVRADLSCHLLKSSPSWRQQTWEWRMSEGDTFSGQGLGGTFSGQGFAMSDFS